MNWRSFRKADIHTRRLLIRESFLGNYLKDSERQDLETGYRLSAVGSDSLDLWDMLVENAMGAMPVPLGLAGGFLIDGTERLLPMATEEPSVIAAASFAANIIARFGGFSTWADEPILHGYVYLSGCKSGSDDLVRTHVAELGIELTDVLSGMSSRGGGLKGIDAAYHVLRDGTNLLRVRIAVDVRDAMGANIVNTCAEALRAPLEKLTHGTSLMCILSNQAESHKAGARFSIPIQELARGGFSGAEVAERIILAYLLADSDPARGVTHNKGIMNGISALALATANDTRGVEAAAHAWAARDGSYKSLSKYALSGDMLTGEIELPLAFGTVGGAVSIHPVSRLCLSLLENPTAVELSRYAAALGLAQNFAALWALTSEGIQKGHMRLHANRLAFLAGARGIQIQKLAEALSQSSVFTPSMAKKLFAELSETPAAEDGGP